MSSVVGQLRSSVIGLAERFDVSALSGPDAVQVVDDLAVIRNVVDGLLAAAAKRVEDTGAHIGTGALDAPNFVARKTGVTVREVRDAIDTAARLESLPATAAQVQSGQLSRTKARLVAQAAAENPEAERELLEKATHGLSPLRDACVKARAQVQDPSERAKRQRAGRKHDLWVTAEGMGAGHYELPPEDFALVKAALERETQRIFRERAQGKDHEPVNAYAADALVNFILGRVPAESADRQLIAGEVKAQIHVFIDHGTLTGRYNPEKPTCEIAGVGPVDVEWVRTLLDTALVDFLVVHGQDVKTIASDSRYLTKAIRTGLAYQGLECDIEGCHLRGYLEIDHTHDYAKGGSTSLDNLGPKCSGHHHLKNLGWIAGPKDPITGKRTLRPPP